MWSKNGDVSGVFDHLCRHLLFYFVDYILRCSSCVTFTLPVFVFFHHTFSAAASLVVGSSVFPVFSLCVMYLLPLSSCLFSFSLPAPGLFLFCYQPFDFCIQALFHETHLLFFHLLESGSCYDTL